MTAFQKLEALNVAICDHLPAGYPTRRAAYLVAIKARAVEIGAAIAAARAERQESATWAAGKSAYLDGLESSLKEALQ